jgi:hypothetical protein
MYANRGSDEECAEKIGVWIQLKYHELVGATGSGLKEGHLVYVDSALDKSPPEAEEPGRALLIEDRGGPWGV